MKKEFDIFHNEDKKIKDLENEVERWRKLAFKYNEEINVKDKIIFNLKQEHEKLLIKLEELCKIELYQKGLK